MKNLKKFLKSIKDTYTQSDKLLHFFVTGFIFYSLMAITNNLDIAIPFTIGVFTGKELYDQFSKNGSGFDVKDMIANLLGLIVSILIYSISLI